MIDYTSIVYSATRLRAWCARNGVEDTEVMGHLEALDAFIVADGPERLGYDLDEVMDIRATLAAAPVCPLCGSHGGMLNEDGEHDACQEARR